MVTGNVERGAKPPYFVRAKFVPWYRSVIIAAACAVAISLWVYGISPAGATSGAKDLAFAPLAAVTFLMIKWHRDAERAYNAAHPPQ